MKSEDKNKNILLIIFFGAVIICGAILAYLHFFYVPKESVQDVVLIDYGENTENTEKNNIEQVIDLNILSHPKIGELQEVSSAPVDYNVGNEKPFEPYE